MTISQILHCSVTKPADPDVSVEGPTDQTGIKHRVITCSGPLCSAASAHSSSASHAPMVIQHQPKRRLEGPGEGVTIPMPDPSGGFVGIGYGFSLAGLKKPTPTATPLPSTPAAVTVQPANSQNVQPSGATANVSAQSSR